MPVKHLSQSQWSRTGGGTGKTVGYAHFVQAAPIKAIAPYTFLHQHRPDIREADHLYDRNMLILTGGLWLLNPGN